MQLLSEYAVSNNIFV